MKCFSCGGHLDRDYINCPICGDNLQKAYMKKNEGEYWSICEEELLKSNCKLIHFGAVIVKNDIVLSKGHNMSLKPENCCLKQKGYKVGKNPSLCYAVHAEWMAIIDVLKNKRSIEESTLYIVGRYPNGRLFKSKFFACIVCARLLKYTGISYIRGKQFNEGKTFTIDEALDSSIEHIMLEE